jgi:hypothetical protein
VSTELSRRTALLTSAYSQLATWQSDMAAAGLKHTGASMTHLTAALERLGAVDDCVRLAKLHEQVRPGDFIAHRAALKVCVCGRGVFGSRQEHALLPWTAFTGALRECRRVPPPHGCR